MLAWLLPVLLAGAAAAKAVADSTAHGSPRLGRWFGTWAGPDSWKRKYLNGDPAQGPAFFLSTTLFVWATDCWHAATEVAWLCADTAVLLAAWAGPGRWWAAAAIALRRCLFQPIYAYLRKP